MKTLITFALAALILAPGRQAHAADKTDQNKQKFMSELANYPLRIKVLSSERGIITTGGGGSTTNCSTVGNDTNCNTSQNAGWKHRTETVEVELNNKIYTVRCATAGGVLALASKCAALQPDDYPARQESNGDFDILYLKGKDYKYAHAVYHVMSVRDATAPQAVIGVVPVKAEPNAEESSANASSAPDKAKLSISSTPDAADIEVDGAFVGNTPSTIDLAAGDHVITVKKSGYKDWQRKIKVTGGEVRLNAELEK